jgi:hypothetical protein
MKIKILVAHEGELVNVAGRFAARRACHELKLWLQLRGRLRGLYPINSLMFASLSYETAEQYISQAGGW